MSGHKHHPIKLADDLLARLRKTAKEKKWTQSYLVTRAMMDFFDTEDRNAGRLRDPLCCTSVPKCMGMAVRGICTCRAGVSVNEADL